MRTRSGHDNFSKTRATIQWHRQYWRTNVCFVMLHLLLVVSEQKFSCRSSAAVAMAEGGDGRVAGIYCWHLMVSQAPRSSRLILLLPLLQSLFMWECVYEIVHIECAHFSQGRTYVFVWALAPAASGKWQVATNCACWSQVRLPSTCHFASSYVEVWHLRWLGLLCHCRTFVCIVAATLYVCICLLNVFGTLLAAM